MTKTLTAPLGTACTSASPHVVSPRAPHVSEHGSGPHAHGYEHVGHGIGGHHHAFIDAEAWTQVFDDPAVAKTVRPIVEPANEQNLDRLAAAVQS